MTEGIRWLGLIRCPADRTSWAPAGWPISAAQARRQAWPRDRWWYQPRPEPRRAVVAGFCEAGAHNGLWISSRRGRAARGSPLLTPVDGVSIRWRRWRRAGGGSEPDSKRPWWHPSARVDPFQRRWATTKWAGGLRPFCRGGSKANSFWGKDLSDPWWCWWWRRAVRDDPK